MQLKIRRGQKSGLTGGVTFTLDVMADLSDEEAALVKKYKLQKETVYASEAAEANAARADQGSWGALGASVMDGLIKRRFSMNDLLNGQHIECKQLGELITTEEQVHAACQNILRYLEIARSFDGSEQVIDIALE